MSEFKVGDRVQVCALMGVSGEVGIVSNIWEGRIAVGFKGDLDLRTFKAEELIALPGGDKEPLTLEEVAQFLITVGLWASEGGYEIPYILRDRIDGARRLIISAFAANRKRQLRDEAQKEADLQRQERKRLAEIIDAAREANGGAPSSTLGIIETVDALRAVGASDT